MLAKSEYTQILPISLKAFCREEVSIRSTYVYILGLLIGTVKAKYTQRIIRNEVILKETFTEL